MRSNTPFRGTALAVAIVLAAHALPVHASAADEPAPAPADASDSDKDSGVFTLGRVQVIGKREATVTELTSVTVDAEQLRANQAHDLAQALDLLPGIALQNVGQRRERLITLHGFSSRQVPLFIDGVPVYVPYDGNVDLSRFLVDYVSRVDVSGGLASVLYGPNILGGAINVVSRRPTAPFEGHIGAGIGLDDQFGTPTSRVQAGVGGIRAAGPGQLYFQANAAYVDAEGYRLPADFVPVPAQATRTRNNAESRDISFSGKIGWVSDNGSEYALSAYNENGQKNVPPYAGSAPGVQARYWQWPYWNKHSLYFIARNELSERATLRSRIYYDSFRNALNSFDNANYDSASKPYAFLGGKYSDYSFGGNADLEWRWNDAQTTRAALHWKNDVHREVSKVGAPQLRFEDSSYAVALEHEWHITPALAVTGGVAWTAQDGKQAQNVIGGVVTDLPVGKADALNRQVVANWGFAPGQWLYAGVAHKTRFPTIKDRFSYRLGSAIPNPDLKPEAALHYELGYAIDRDRWQARATVYQARLQDAIQNVVVAANLCTAPNPTCFQQQNVGRQRNRGVDLSFGMQVSEGLRVQAIASWLQQRVLNDPTILVTDIPDRKFRLAADWDINTRWALHGDVQHESRRYSTSDGTRVAGPFTLVNAYVRYGFSANDTLEVGMSNLTDKLYAYQEGFYEPGRRLFVNFNHAF